MKKRAIILCKIGVFVVIFAVCMHFLTEAFRMKDEATISSEFYKYKDHSFDVITFGTSFVMNGVNPMQLWDEYGVTSYCLGAGNESIATSYYLAKEAIKRQHPKLIVLECGTAYWDWVIMSTEQFHHATDTMPLLSKNRTQMILDLGYEYREALLLPFESYHMRWTDLNESDFEEDYKNHTLGAELSMRSDGGQEFERHEIVTENAINETQMEYIEKIVQLCEDTDTEIMMLVLPVPGPSFVLDQYTFDQRRNAAYAMEEYCADKGIHCLNLTDSLEELGLDPTTDTIEGSHVNMRGAQKVTSYIGDYITQNYDLTDRRGNPSYAFMDDVYEEYLETYQEKRILTSTKPDDFLDALCDEEYRDRYVVVLTEGAPAGNLSAENAERLMRLGVCQDLSAIGSQAYVAVFDGEASVYESSLSEGLPLIEDEVVLEDQTSIAFCSDSANNGQSWVQINGTEYRTDHAGLNIVVYDKQTEKVLTVTAASDKGIW